MNRLQGHGAEACWAKQYTSVVDLNLQIVHVKKLYQSVNKLDLQQSISMKAVSSTNSFKGLPVAKVSQGKIT